MLRELHISNLAVISDVRIEFTPGLNCFTGSTGAGKSLVIGALQVLLGLRSPAEMLRPGMDEGRVTGVFDLGDQQLLCEIERATDVRIADDGGELLITRRLYASGRSSISLNGHPITLGMLKLIAEKLVDVHGQHDHQFLLKPANQLEVLDQFGAAGPLLQRYHNAYEKLQLARARLADLSANRTLRHQQLELYRFQADEIDAAELNPAEYAELHARSSVLKNLEKLKKDAGGVYAALYEADGSALERLKMMTAILSELAMLDIGLKETSSNMRDAAIALEEVAFDLSRYLDKLDLDPGELAQVDERLNVIHRVLNKYGQSVEQALALRADLQQRIAELERATDDLTSLQQELEPLAREVRVIGDELTSRRRAAAARLAPLVEKQLAELGMEKARFTISFAPGEEDRPDGGPAPDSAAQPGPSGFDHIEFIVQTNPGQLPHPLRKIASGGELSRIMLALKGILAKSDRISVLVFDEIDANVGGRLGSIIGGKLQSLATHHQILCITHLSQIACYADQHLTVRKSVSGNSTETSVRLMQGHERIEELAEMIGGRQITDTTRAQARELLENATVERSVPKKKKSSKQSPAAQSVASKKKQTLSSAPLPKH